MALEDKIYEALNDEALEYDKDYTASELRDVWSSRGFVQTFHGMFTHETRERSGDYGKFLVVTSGGNRNRTYRFKQTDTKQAKVPTDPESKLPLQGADSRKNDHPEDRHHISAHVAWYMHRGCIALSMPKTLGRRTETGKHEHADMIGVVVSRPVTKQEIPLPAWMQRSTGAVLPEAIILAAEVKHEINTISDLFEAIREGRHNTRYFDEGWLLADIREDLHTQARDLAEEYNLGVISVAAETLRSVTLWTPRHAARMRRPQDYFSRFVGDLQQSADQLIMQLSNCKSLAESLLQRQRTDGPAGSILEQLFTSQQQQSLVERLPETIKTALQSDGASKSDDDDIRAYANVLFAVFERAYVESAFDENMTDFYIRTLGRGTRNALLTADYFSRHAVDRFSSVFVANLQGESDDIKRILDAGVLAPKSKS